MPDSSIIRSRASTARRAAAAWSLTACLISAGGHLAGRLEIGEPLGHDGGHQAVVEVHAALPPAMEYLKARERPVILYARASFARPG